MTYRNRMRLLLLSGPLRKEFGREEKAMPWWKEGEAEVNNIIFL